MDRLSAEDWPLVGRAGTIDAVSRIIRAGERAGVIMVGHPGVGRTRLARAALAAAVSASPQSRSWVPGWVAASRSTASIPLGALAHLLPDLELGDGSTGRLLIEARRLLRRVAQGTRLLLAVDDAHLLDETSAVLLSQLAASGEAFLLLTAPTGVPVPDPLFELWKETVIERIDLPELTRGESDRLVVRALGGQVDRAALRQFWTLALGNPLFLRELVDAGLADGSLRRSGEVWRWDGPFPLTSRMVEMVLLRAGTLGGPEQELLRLLAFGQPLGSDVAAALTSPQTVAVVEERGLVTSRRAGARVEVSLAHPMYGEVLRRHSTPLQERAAYRRLLEHAGTQQSHRADDRRRALAWRTALGEPSDTAELLTAAAAAEENDPQLAERLARAAARSGGPRARLTHGRILVHLGRAVEAEQLLAALDAELARNPDGSTELRLNAATLRVRNQYWGLCDLAGVARTVAAVGEPGAPTSGSPAQVALRAFALLLEGRDEEAAEVAGALTGEPDGVGGAGLAGLSTAALAEVRCGRPGRAAALARRGLDVSGEPDPAGGWLRFELIAVSWFADLQDGGLDAAEKLATRCHQDALTSGHRHRIALYATFLGIVAARRGRLRTAVRWLYEAAAGVPAARFAFTVPLVSELAVALAGLGELARAHEVFAEGGVQESVGLLAGWREPARVWLAGVGGRVTEAERIALDAADDGTSHGHRVGALHAAVRLGVTGAVTDLLADLTAGREVALAALYSAHGAALAAHDPDGLDDVAERFADLGLLLCAAEAAAQASAAHRVAGHVGSAGGSASRARAWAERCEGAATPALDLLEGSVDLTRREMEIASLAASGLTSKAIAGQLVVSVRTVDNVLRAVYAKLGVSGRGDLAQVAGIRAPH